MSTSRLSPLVQTAARRFAEAVRAAAGENLVALRLFGSYARGEPHEESDVDICVVLRSASWAERREILDLAADLWLELDVYLSPTILPEDVYLTWQRQDRPLVRAIEREGIAL